METVKILVAGDFCPVLRIQDLAIGNQPELVFNDFIYDLQENDLNIVDLECPLIEEGTPILKSGPHLIASPKAIGLLKYGNIGLVAMANNHIRDYGSEGLLKTMELNHENKIATVGAGKNLEEARKPFLTNIKGKQIAILNITENEWSNTHGNVPGANPLDLIDNQADIMQARQNADVIVVIFHGGNEFYELPSPGLKKVLHFLADAGASAIISHHTHVSSGYEVYNSVPIFYSTGNFCYDTVNAPFEDWYYGYAVKLIIGKKIDFEIIPFVQNLSEPGIRKLNDKEKGLFLQRLNRLKKIISDDRLLESRFNEYCDRNAFRYDLLFEPYRNKYLAFLRKRKLIPSFVSKRKKRLFLNIIRCEAHRDMILHYLGKYDN